MTTDVISFGIPQLQSRNAMKSANAVTDFWNGYVELFGRKVNLHFTSSGHYCIQMINIASNLPLKGNCNSVLNLNCLNNRITIIKR